MLWFVFVAGVVLRTQQWFGYSWAVLRASDSGFTWWLLRVNPPHLGSPRNESWLGFNDNSQSPRHAFDLTFPAQCLDPGVYFHLHQDWSKPCHPNREESCGSRCTSDSCLSYSENWFRASRLIWAVLVMCLSYNTALLFQNTFCLCVSHESQMRQKLME